MSGARKNCKYVGNIRDLKKTAHLWYQYAFYQQMSALNYFWCTMICKEMEWIHDINNIWQRGQWLRRKRLLRSSAFISYTNLHQCWNEGSSPETLEGSELVGAFRAIVMLWTVNRTTQKSLKAFPWNKYNLVIFGERWTNTSSKEWWRLWYTHLVVYMVYHQRTTWWWAHPVPTKLQTLWSIQPICILPNVHDTNPRIAGLFCFGKMKKLEETSMCM